MMAVASVSLEPKWNGLETCAIEDGVQYCKTQEIG